MAINSNNNRVSFNNPRINFNNPVILDSRNNNNNNQDSFNNRPDNLDNKHRDNLDKNNNRNRMTLMMVCKGPWIVEANPMSLSLPFCDKDDKDNRNRRLPARRILKMNHHCWKNWGLIHNISL